MPTIPITWTNLTNAAINGNGELEKTVDTLGGAGCMDNASGSGDAGAWSNETVTGPDWEFACTLGPGSGSGRSFVGVTSGSFSVNFTLWDYTWHVSTFNNTSGTPHPPDSIFVYQGSPPNLTYRDGIWNEGDDLRIVCTGATVRFYLNSLLVYTSSLAPSYPIRAIASLACLGGTVVNPRFITGSSGGGGGSSCGRGSDVGDSCSDPWTVPTPAAFPTAIKFAYFNELEEDWREKGQAFPDGVPAFTAILAAGIRVFEFETVPLSKSEAAVIDGHWDSTRGGLAFTLTHPHTAEVITGVRYDGKLEYPPHTKVWAQTRTGRFIKYTS